LIRYISIGNSQSVFIVWDDLSASQFLVEELDYDTLMCYLDSPVKIIWAKGTFVPTFGSALINVGKTAEALVERSVSNQPMSSGSHIDLTSNDSVPVV
jgi:hypothetical protein